MNRKRYEATVRFFSENKTAYRLLWIIYRVLPYILLFSYPALIVAEFFIMGVTGTWANLIILPFAVLTAVTLLRFMIREQRPYEKYGMNSVFWPLFIPLKTNNFLLNPFRHFLILL